EDEAGRLVVQPRLAHEVDVLLENVPAGIAIAVEGDPAAVGIPEVVVAVVDVVEHQRLVVAPQERTRVLLAQLEQPLDHAPRVRPTIDVVTDENEVVVRGKVEPRKQQIEGSGAAVDVAYGNEPHRT